MIHSPFFSVIIPTYNRGHLIMKTLQSVFDQTYRDFEIIVVDNCSTDSTISLLKPLADDRRIVLIRHDQNYERAVSRNTGISAARGRFITFLDSDDMMYPSNLSDAYSFACSKPDLHVFHNLYELINDEGLPIYQYKFPSLHNPAEAIASGNFLSCIGGFLSDQQYPKLRFDTSEVLQGIEDWEFWLRVLAVNKIGRIDKVNSGIVHHKGRSVVSLALSDYSKKREYVVQKIHSDPMLSEVYGPYLDSFRASCSLLMASMANSAGLFKEAKTYLKEALYIKGGILFTSRFQRILLKAVLGLKSKIDG